MQVDHLCANPGCDCKVPNAGDYCDENCRRQAAGEGSEECECGHATCQHRPLPEQGE